MTAPTNNRDRAAYLRSLAASWSAEYRTLGPRPRLRCGHRRDVHAQRVRPWVDRATAIAGATLLADALAHDAVQDAADAVLQSDAALEVRAVELRRTGLTFAAVASTLGIPIGTAKTWCRRARLAQGGAA